MSNKRFQGPFPRIQPNGASKPASDFAKIVWRDSMGPLQAISDALNVVVKREQQRVVEMLAQHDHIDLKSHVLNIDTWQWVPAPQEMKANDPAPSHPSG